MQKSLVSLAILLTTACGNSEPPTVLATIGATGGELTSDDGMVALRIPEGALSAETEITVRKSGDDGTVAQAGFTPGTVYVFGPEGTEFAQPVTLEFAATAGDVRVARLVDGAVAKFAEETHVDPVTGRITASVRILSSWGVTSCAKLFCLAAEPLTAPDRVSVSFRAEPGFSLSRAVKSCPGATTLAQCEAQAGPLTFTAWQVFSGGDTELEDADVAAGPNLYAYRGPDEVTEVRAFLNHVPPSSGDCTIGVTIAPNPTTYNSATVATVTVDRKGTGGPITIALGQAPVEHSATPIPDGQNMTSITMFPFQVGTFPITFTASLGSSISCATTVDLTVNALLKGTGIR